MVFARTLSLFVLGAVVLSPFASALEAEPPLEKRSSLTARQTCRTAGWIPACPGPFSCVPPGAVCCSDGITYVMPPDSCPSGTDAIATAIPDDDGGPEPSSVTTPPPTVSTLPPVVDYVWYTYTFTWYYWYYYYVYVDVASTRLVSTQIATVTTISYTATDEAAASDYFDHFTATAVLPIPTQTATSVSGSVAPSSYPAETSSSSVVVPSSNGTVTSAAPSSIVTAGAAKTGPGGGWGSLSFMVGTAVLGLLSGVVMIAL